MFCPQWGHFFIWGINPPFLILADHVTQGLTETGGEAAGFAIRVHSPREEVLGTGKAHYQLGLVFEMVPLHYFPRLHPPFPWHYASK
jgi:hypothetical protein